MSVGDSATIDCGIGALSVLGIRFLNRKNEEIELNCRGLLTLNEIDATQMRYPIKETRITIASDVRNILTGKKGAIVYARQKGAKPSQLTDIDKALKRFRKIVLRQFSADLDKIPGSGAAGGIGGAFVALLNAQIISGFGLVKELVYFEDALKSCDMLITGEGRIDKQSFSGKTLGRILELNCKYKKPVILVCGYIKSDIGSLKKYHIVSKYSLVQSAKSLNQAVASAPKLLQKLATKIGKTLVK